jgi:hypothetical protein
MRGIPSVAALVVIHLGFQEWLRYLKGWLAAKAARQRASLEARAN